MSPIFNWPVVGWVLYEGCGRVIKICIKNCHGLLECAAFVGNHPALLQPCNKSIPLWMRLARCTARRDLPFGWQFSGNPLGWPHLDPLTAAGEKRSTGRAQCTPPSFWLGTPLGSHSAWVVMLSTALQSRYRLDGVGGNKRLWSLVLVVLVDDWPAFGVWSYMWVPKSRVHATLGNDFLLQYGDCSLLWDFSLVHLWHP